MTCGEKAWVGATTTPRLSATADREPGCAAAPDMPVDIAARGSAEPAGAADQGSDADLPEGDARESVECATNVAGEHQVYTGGMHSDGCATDTLMVHGDMDGVFGLSPLRSESARRDARCQGDDGEE